MDELVYLVALENLEEAENQHLFNNQRNPSNPFTCLSKKQFVNMFRLSKELCRYVIQMLEPLMRPPSRANDLDVRTKVLVASRFFAGGGYQLDVSSNKYLDVCQSTTSNCIAEVVEALIHPTVFNTWVKFPSNFRELNHNRTAFYQQHHFPGVIGCIDCTHVAIFPPKKDDPEFPEHLYVNRKNYHSINVQLVCDTNLRIINVNARYPGSTNDAFIWNNSNLQDLMRDLHQRGHTDYFLLGDSGYPLRTWLLTPVEGDLLPNAPENLYNIAHRSTRATIERCNGLLKARFRCLLKHRVLHYTPLKACKIIQACTVLHNMCIEYNVPEPDFEEDIIDFGMYADGNNDNDLENIAMGRINPELADGRRARNRIILQLRREN